MGSDFYFEIERDTDRWTRQREVQGRVAQILSLVQEGVERGESSDLWSILPATRIKDFMRTGDNLNHNCHIARNYCLVFFLDWARAFIQLRLTGILTI